MADEQAQARTQEAMRRTQESARRSVQEAVHVSEELTRLGAETVTVWTRVNQQVWRDMMDLGSKASQQGVHLMTQLQQASVDAWRDFQDGAVRWSTSWPDAFRDPMRFYQRMLEQSMDATRRSLTFSRQTSETVNRSLQEMQHTAEEASRSVQQAFQDGTSKLEEVTRRTERLHAA
jgi:hypothetical protein